MNISDITRATSVQSYTQPVVSPARASESTRAGENATQTAAQPLARTGKDAPQVNKPAVLYANQPANTQDSQASQVSQAAQASPLNAALEKTEASPEELASALEKIEKFVSVTASDILFSIDKESGSTIIKVIDSSTQEVIRQIPSEEMLEISRALDQLQGLFLKNKA